ncbi:MAG TPA: hypothetical protein PK677_02230 [Acidiphilium sp.]|nr:hypothetical protein [Acidiphilium sp.]HQU24579.1 hypothetical protein [Acidiphilium sp.]
MQPIRQSKTLIRRTSIVTLACLGLAGCGTSAPPRVGGAAAGGAATGATFGLIGGPVGVLIGGAIGGGIGALTAANTTPKQVNLGNPPWTGGSYLGGTNTIAQPATPTAAPQPVAPTYSAPPPTYSPAAPNGVQSTPLPPPQ